MRIITNHLTKCHAIRLNTFWVNWRIQCIFCIIREFNISVHCYADDTQLYCSFKPGITECDVLETLERCIDKLRVWMNSNKLKLNDDKTEFMILGSPNSLKQVKTESIRIWDFNIKAVASVRNIGTMFDSQMKMEVQVRSMCKSAWYHLYNISKVRRLLTLDQTKTVIHAYVTSKIDSNNALLSGLPTCLLHKLQLVQNAAARVVTRNKKGDHVTPLLIELHWLPVDKRILYKIMLTCFKALNDIGPIYISDLLTVSTPNRPGLRSDDDILQLVLPKTRLKTYGDRAFSYYAVYHWNRLPFSIRASPTITTFKSRLKTHFFKDSFGATWLDYFRYEARVNIYNGILRYTNDIIIIIIIIIIFAGELLTYKWWWTA